MVEADKPVIMLVVADEEACLLHQVAQENILGSGQPYREAPRRLSDLLKRLRHSLGEGPELPFLVEFEVVGSADHGLDAILAVHDERYIDWLKRCYTEWIGAGGSKEGVVARIAYHPAFAGFSKPDPSALNADGQAGLYSWDLGHTVAKDTFVSAYAAAQVAISSAKWLLGVSSDSSGAAPCIFAATRPPGHHASCDTTGGYCYINNAAIAARLLAQSGTRVAIVDIDAHFGNGTAQMFYEDANVYYTSLHADKTFPHYGGRADETGAGEGRGMTRNFPLPVGTDEDTYLETLDEALEGVKSFDPAFLVVSLGVDTYIDDPFQLFKITKTGYNRIGRRLAQLQLPTLLVMEGGYNLDDLPELFERTLSSFAAEAHRLGQVKSLRRS